MVTRFTISFVIFNGLCVSFSIIILPFADLILGDSSIGWQPKLMNQGLLTSSL